MFLRVIAFILGIILLVTGIVMMVIYLNLLVNGYTFLEYVNFIIRRFECLSSLFGLLLIYLSIFVGRKDEIHLRYTTKL